MGPLRYHDRSDGFYTDKTPLLNHMSPTEYTVEEAEPRGRPRLHINNHRSTVSGVRRAAAAAASSRLNVEREKHE